MKHSPRQVWEWDEDRKRAEQHRALNFPEFNGAGTNDVVPLPLPLLPAAAAAAAALADISAAASSISLSSSSSAVTANGHIAAVAAAPAASASLAIARLSPPPYPPISLSLFQNLLLGRYQTRARETRFRLVPTLDLKSAGLYMCLFADVHRCPGMCMLFAHVCARE